MASSSAENGALLTEGSTWLCHLWKLKTKTKTKTKSKSEVLKKSSTKNRTRYLSLQAFEVLPSK
jgi:hypothetical protein